MHEQHVNCGEAITNNRKCDGARSYPLQHLLFSNMSFLKYYYQEVIIILSSSLCCSNLRSFA